MIRRHLSVALEAAASSYPVVTVTGPRQSGKTTLVRSVFAGCDYASLESPDLRTLALEDPRGFLGQFAERVILDEVQRAPDLLSYIQGLVDEEDRPGRYILTGSQDLLLMSSISQSLAGRCAVLHLLPLARTELAGQEMMNVAEIGRGGRGDAAGRADLFEMLWTGFYPRIHDKRLAPQGWLGNYYQTYLERDVRELVNVGDTETFSRFVRLCAGRCGQILNIASLAADAGVSHTTARRWLSTLEAGFLILLLRPHYRNFNKRLIKSPKLYFLDSGLLCYLLRIRSPEDLGIHASRGAVFEAWVVSEMLKNYLNRGVESDMYFWRDSTGHEIDLVIDRGDEMTAIEIKSGETVAGDFFKNLGFWRRLPGQADAPTALVYGGERSFVRQGTSVISWKHWG